MDTGFSAPTDGKRLAQKILPDKNFHAQRWVFAMRIVDVQLARIVNPEAGAGIAINLNRLTLIAPKVHFQFEHGSDAVGHRGVCARCLSVGAP